MRKSKINTEERRYCEEDASAVLELRKQILKMDVGFYETINGTFCKVDNVNKWLILEEDGEFMVYMQYLHPDSYKQYPSTPVFDEQGAIIGADKWGYDSMESAKEAICEHICEQELKLLLRRTEK